MVKFYFNNGEVKDLDKSLANLLKAKEMGDFEPKEFNPPLNKASKVVQRRKTK